MCYPEITFANPCYEPFASIAPLHQAFLRTVRKKKIPSFACERLRTRSLAELAGKNIPFWQKLEFGELIGE
jgi:hypothetical protein